MYNLKNQQDINYLWLNSQNQCCVLSVYRIVTLNCLVILVSCSLTELYGYPVPNIAAFTVHSLHFSSLF